MPGTTTNQNLLEWVDKWAEVLTPDSVYWCDGTQEAVSYTHLTLPTIYSV